MLSVCVLEERSASGSVLVAGERHFDHRSSNCSLYLFLRFTRNAKRL